MNVLDIVGGIFKPAAELIDNLHTSKEEKLQQKAVLLDLQTSFLTEALQYEQEQMKAKAEIIKAEASSQSWVTRSWRPITMLSFVAAVLAYWFGLTPDLPEKAVDNMFLLVQIGIGGYVAGRSIEKVVPSAVAALKKKDETG